MKTRLNIIKAKYSFARDDLDLITICYSSDMKTKAHLERAMALWGSLTLTLIAFLANPGLIDGISYFKVALGIVLMSILAPFLVFWFVNQPKLHSQLILFTCVLALFFFISTDGKNDYREVFGAPGRSNGFLSAIVFGYFILFGIFLSLTSGVKYVVSALRVSSFGISLTILIENHLVSFQDTPLAAWNLGNQSFGENSNLIAPLIGMGIVHEIQRIIERYNKKNLLFIIVPALALIEMRLLQSFLAVFAGILVMWVVRNKEGIRSFLIPGVITFSFVFGLWATQFSIFRQDLSIQERRIILLQFDELLKHVTLFPNNVEALSDFTKSFDSLQIVDDFHNVYYQLFFSYGILLGICFIYLTIKPFWSFSTNPSLKVIFLPIYTVFFISLFVGIASPNYLYFGATFVGIALSSSPRRIDRMRHLAKTRKSLLIFVTFPFFFWPIATQTADYTERIEISNLISRGGYSELNREKIVDKVVNLPDAGYRYIVARNFYVIGDCDRGNKVLSYMQNSNPKETRINRLFELKDSCI